MPNHKTGTTVPCRYCGTLYYKKPSDDKFQKRATCGSSECRSTHRMGENNPFWGKTHSPETMERLKAARRVQVNRHNSKGYRHTPEAREKMSAALKARWAEKRESMMEKLPRGEDHHWKKEAEYIRHRQHFSAVQRKEWKSSSCVWCDAVDELVLDHIMPVVAGGKNVRENCQTLCRTCNLWKMWYVDRPLTIAMKATSGAD